MMRLTVYHVLLCFALTAPGVALADPPGGYPFVDFDLGLARARAENKPLLIYFGRYGCAWCDHVNRKTFSDEALKQRLSENYVLVYIDAEGSRRLRLPSGERLTEADYGARLGAYATPLFIYMTPEGRQVAKVPGYKTVDDFLDYDRYVSGKHYTTQTLSEFLGSRK